MSSRSFKSFILLAVLLVGVFGAASPAYAAPPKEVKGAQTGDNDLAAPPRMVSMDGSGQTFVVVTRADPHIPGEDIYFYTLTDPSVMRRVELTSPAASATSIGKGLALVAVPAGDAVATGFAVAGLDKRVHYFDLPYLDRPDWSATLDFQPFALAVPGNGNHVIVAEMDTTLALASNQSRVSIWSNPQPSPSNPAVRKTPVFNQPVADLAASKGSDLVALGLKRAGSLPESLHLYRTGAASLATPVYSYSSFSGAIVDVAVSDDGKFVAVVTRDQHWLYLFDYTAPSTSVRPISVKLPSAPVSLAMDGAGRNLAVGLSTGKVALYENERIEQIATPTARGETRAFGTRVSDIAFSKDGSMLLATFSTPAANPSASAASTLAAFRPPVTRTGNITELWQQSVSGFLASNVATSWDGKTIGIAGTKGEGKGAAYAFRQFSAVQLTATGTDTKALPDTGDGVTFSARVQNTGSLHANYTLSGDLRGATQTTGWTAQFSRPSFDLAPGESQDVDVTFHAPPGVSPATYTVELVATAKDGTKNSVPFTVTVGTLHRLQLKAKDDIVSLNFEPSGVPKTFHVLVENRGNVDETVTFRVEQQVTNYGAPWTVTPDPATLVVKKGQTETVAFQVTPPANTPSGQISTLSVTARVGQIYTSPALELRATMDARPTVQVVPTKAEYQTLRIPAGTGERIFLHLNNTGNIEDTYRVWANVTPPSRATQWDVRLDTTETTLKAGASKRLSLYVQPLFLSSEQMTIVVEVKSELGASTLYNITAVRLPPVVEEEPETQAWYTVPGFEGVVAAAAAVAAALAIARRRNA